MKFKGDIIITDPCYIIKEREKDYSTHPKAEDYFTTDFIKDKELYAKQYKKYDEAVEEWNKNNPDDWNICNYGENMEALGITTYLTEETMYGDWSCTTFEEGTRKELGQFCADAGLVSVFLLEEVLKYNPEFDYHINNPWTTTLIKDFDGEVTIQYNEKQDVNQVVGKGNVNFFTLQTGF